MAVIDVSDLETYMGTTFTDSQSAQASYIVGYVNGFIEDETLTSFGLEVGAVFREKADVIGEVVFRNIPVQAVTTVHDYRTDTDLDPNCWYFDGIDTVRGLFPGQVVDITMDYGIEPVPGSVTGVALSLGKRAMNQLISNTDSGVTLKQVGDVIYEFGEVLTPTTSEQLVLDSYTVTEHTMKLDFNPSRRHCWCNCNDIPNASCECCFP